MKCRVTVTIYKTCSHVRVSKLDWNMKTAWTWFKSYHLLGSCATHTKEINKSPNPDNPQQLEVINFWLKIILMHVLWWTWTAYLHSESILSTKDAILKCHLSNECLRWPSSFCLKPSATTVWSVDAYIIHISRWWRCKITVKGGTCRSTLNEYRLCTRLFTYTWPRSNSSTW